MPSTIKKVVSMKLIESQFPEMVYTVSDKIGSNSFILDTGNPGAPFTIIIPNGSYSSASIVDAINTAIATTSANVELSYNPDNGLMTFTQQGGFDISLNFNYSSIDCPQLPSNIYKDQLTLGWLLGFRGNYIKPITWDGTFPPLEDRRYKERIKPVFNHFFELIETECKKFTEKDKAEIEDHFEELLKQVEDIQVAELTIDSNIEAFNLFERLNARGTMLSITDLLKNHIFAKQDKDLQDIWTKIDEDFSKNQLSIITMVRYFYMSQRGHIRKKNLYRELKSLANKNPKKFMSDLEHFSDFYVSINSLGPNSFETCKNILDEQFKIDLQKTDRYFNIFKSLYGLKRCGISQTIPLIYSILSTFDRLDLYIESRLRNTLTEFFENLERYHFISNFICKDRANKVEELYGNMAAKFYKADSAATFEETIYEFYTEIPSIPGFDTFEENFIQLDYENNNKDIKEIFSRMNMANEDGVSLPMTNAQTFMLDPTKRRDTWNTEHWFPQKPQDNTINERLENSDIIHNIGNLILIPTELNSKLNNISPEEKAKKIKEDKNFAVLANGHLKLFIDENECFHRIWADKHIIDRAKTLAAQCYNVYWKYDPKIRSKGGNSINKI